MARNGQEQGKKMFTSSELKTHTSTEQGSKQLPHHQKVMMNETETQKQSKDAKARKYTWQTASVCASFLCASCRCDEVCNWAIAKLESDQ